jgi:hypothetical protein
MNNESLKVNQIPEGKIQCPCGSVVGIKNMSKHKQSEKHLKFSNPEAYQKEEQEIEEDLQDDEGEDDIELIIEDIDTKVDNVLELQEDLAEKVVEIETSLTEIQKRNLSLETKLTEVQTLLNNHHTTNDIALGSLSKLLIEKIDANHLDCLTKINSLFNRQV